MTKENKNLTQLRALDKEELENLPSWIETLKEIADKSVGGNEREKV